MNAICIVERLGNFSQCQSDRNEMLPHFTHQGKEIKVVKALFSCLVPVFLSETGEAAGFVSSEAS